MSESKTDKLIGWFGSLNGIVGSVLLALNNSLSGYGYLFLLLSSIALIAWSYRNNANHTLTMQVCFCIINVIGIYNWLM